LSTRKMEPLMELAGHSASLLKLAAFLLSSTIAGVAGVLIAVGRPSLSPQLFGVDTSISLLAVFVLSGGLSHPTSPLRIFSTQLVLSLLIQLLQMWSWMPPSLIIAAYYLLLAIALLTSFIRKSRRDC
jgi:ABC-type branched-subunit amino acid transport system permease subunit